MNVADGSIVLVRDPRKLPPTDRLHLA